MPGDKRTEERLMKLGLIGKPLGHSWSPGIHKFLIGEDYGLWELNEHELADFFSRRDFDGINVTIPYKTAVIPYLDRVDEAAERMGAVNCVVNKGGELIGYNTDYTGLRRMIERRGITNAGGRVCILGSGGASKAAEEVCRSKGWEYDIVSRSGGAGRITYDELYDRGDDYTLLINATPVGMSPNMDECPVDMKKLEGLKYVVDIVANPLRTRLCFEASIRGIETCGGLEMLVSQALSADEIFLGEKLDEGLVSGCMSYLLKERRNIVLIGMPSSGKTTIGKIISEKSGMEFIDTDDEIIKRIGMTIPEFFEKEGEREFRRIESEVCRDLSCEQGRVIATGGGAVESEDNMRRLAYNGLLVYLDTPSELLTATDSRPLSADADKLMALYERRLPLYEGYADEGVDNSRGLEIAADEIIRIAKTDNIRKG